MITKWFYQIITGFASNAYGRDNGGFGRGYGGGMPSTRRPGCTGCLAHPRVIMALLMIGGAIAYHYLGTTKYENPFTGRTQRLAMPTPEEEIAMGLQSAPQMIREMGGEHPNQQAQATVDRVGERLINTTAVKETPYQFDFYLLNDDRTVNAFALPGGQIFITSALFTLLENEDQLAGVLGHEIGHVVGRHSNEQMAQGRLWQMIGQGAGILLSDGGGAGGMQVGQMVAGMMTMKYGRDDELESDALAVKFMLQAQYDPEAMIGVMEILAKSSGGGGQPEILSTHPNPGNRAEKIRELIAKMRNQSVSR
jgi:predicted Zn-dependent protease